MIINAEYILLNEIAYWGIFNAALFVLCAEDLELPELFSNQFILFILENNHGIATSNANKLKKCYA